MSFKVRVANFLKSSAFGRWIYPVVQKTYRAYAIPKRRKRLQRYGWSTLQHVHEIFTSHKVPYFFDYGTLLGLIREHGFIKHDDDIDLTILPGTFSPREIYTILLAGGFTFLHGFKIGLRIVEFTAVDRNGLTVDIFFPRQGENEKFYGVDIFWDPQCTYPSERENSVTETEYTMPSELMEMSVNGVVISVPKDYIKLLVEEFGTTWNIPDAKFVARECIPCKKLDEYAVRISEEELMNSND